MTNNQTEQCIEYFKRNKGFKRVFYKIREKYESLGSLGGNISLTFLTKEEKEVLTGFMKKDYSNQKSALISIQKFIKALENTKFEGVDFLQVLQGYFDEELVPKKQQKQKYEEEKAEYFEEVLDSFEGTVAKSWLEDELEGKKSLYKILSMRYDENKVNLKKDLNNICKAINNLPYRTNEKKRLAVFASKFTGNPHGLDEKTSAHVLFIYGISYILHLRIPQNAEEKSEMLYEAGIVKDDLSNYTSCIGLLGYTKEGIHRGWEEFFKKREPLLISLWNLMNIEKVTSPGNRVYVVENPTVFSEIIDNTSSSSISLICTYGQIKLASFMLLDLLMKEKVEIYYSGDFDPEGLLIADKLKQRYKDQLILWGYTKENYLKYLSKETLSKSRLKKLRNLKDESLIQIGELMSTKGVAAYQEMFIEELITTS